MLRDSTGNGHDVSVSFGAQHTLGDRLAIYGALGFAYERAKTEITTSELRRTAPRSARGAATA